MSRNACDLSTSGFASSAVHFALYPSFMPQSPRLQAQTRQQKSVTTSSGMTAQRNADEIFPQVRQRNADESSFRARHGSGKRWTTGSCSGPGPYLVSGARHGGIVHGKSCLHFSLSVEKSDDRILLVRRADLFQFPFRCESWKGSIYKP